MIQVIKEGTKRQIECGECGSVLRYEKEDVQVRQMGYNEHERYIKCPCCKEEIRIR